MAGVFINYRRDEEGDRATRLYAVLRRHVGADRVFMDSEMELGLDFHEQLGTEVGRCNVVLAVMGRDWSNVKAPDGSRALDDPRDWVRVELEIALPRRDVRVIPVLVGGAVMPAEEELPPLLRPLVRRQGRRLRHDSFDEDAQSLAEAVRRYLEQTGPPTDPEGERAPVGEPKPDREVVSARGPRAPVAAAASVAGASLLGAALVSWPAWKAADAINRDLRETLVEDSERLLRLATYRGVFWLLVAAAAAACAAVVAQHGRAAAEIARASLAGLLAGAVAGAITQAFRNAEIEDAGEILSFALLGVVIGASGVVGPASAPACAGGLIGGLLGGWFLSTPRDLFVGALVPALLIVGGAGLGMTLGAWQQQRRAR
jgi:hypothetical protein